MRERWLTEGESVTVGSGGRRCECESGCVRECGCRKGSAEGVVGCGSG